MRFSKYTSLIPFGKFTILFEALSGRFMVFKDLSIDKSNDCIARLEQTNKPIFTKLVETNVLVNDDFDEENKLRLRIEKADNNNEVFYLNINPTLDCNFKCWYCYENHIIGSEMNNECLSAVVAFVENLINTNKQLKHLHIGFFGGEPLLKFDNIIKPIIEQTSKLCKKHNIRYGIAFTTNGYLIDEHIIDCVRNSNATFQITFDGDRQHHNKTRFEKLSTGSYDVILQNVFNLLQNKINVILRINYTSKNIESVKHILDDLMPLDSESKKCLNVDFQRVWQERQPKEDLSEDMAQTLRSDFIGHGFKVNSNYVNPVDDTCYGNCSNHALINYNGEVFGCTARDFTTANRVGYLTSGGEIKYDEPKHSDRLHSRFSKNICKSCRIAPYCGGGCAQRAYEAKDIEGCIYCYDDDDIDNIILKIFDQVYCTNNNYYCHE